MSAHLELERLEKTYPDGTRAVKGIDFAAAAGEFIVLLGPSGCGKTTTLRMTAGLELPTGGAIRLAGVDVSQQRPSRRDVGFVFQFYALYPHLTVAQNLAFPLECVGTPRAARDAAVADLAHRLELGPLLSRKPRELSGGDQQRVALGRAMIRRPQIWLMDEPLGTLDADRRLAMCEFLRVQQLEAKVTTLYVTHDQEEAMRLADRIVVMHDGKIEQVGAPMAVYDEPASLFVAHFVGSPGMNFLEGSLARGSDGWRFVARAAADRAAAPAAALELPLPPALARAPLREGPATLGIRPEFVRLAAAGPLRATVVLDEYLGASRCLHLDTPCGPLVARVAPEAGAAIGATVALDFSPAHVRLFDPESGARLR
ncbi:MAG: ABC transporter ATP-binding protein [Planctomycetes bacterium]|nr:ABC transporter ATP-binding protein [Planctomycetota bacterium]